MFQLFIEAQFQWPTALWHLYRTSFSHIPLDVSFHKNFIMRLYFIKQTQNNIDFESPQKRSVIFKKVSQNNHTYDPILFRTLTCKPIYCTYRAIDLNVK